jgi:butyryl-CoA dehydrogenase
MEFFSLVLVGWSWLEIGVVTKRAIITGDKSFDSSFLESKLNTLEYFYAYELPKTTGLAEIIVHPSSITIKKEKRFIV